MGTSNRRTARQKLGNRGEDLAAQFLEDKGYTILARNYHADRAEIDIVCEAEAVDEGVLGDIVFVDKEPMEGAVFEIFG